MTKPIFGLKVKYRDYKCLCCGHEQQVQTNHTDVCYDHCKGCSWRSNFVEPGHVLNFIAGSFRPFKFVGQPPTKEDDYNVHSGIRWTGVDQNN